MRTLLLLVLAAVVGCAPERPDPPPEVRIVEVPVEVYVPIDEKYTRPCTWIREGAIADIFEVTAGRKHCLEVYEADRETVRKIEGTPKP